MIESHWVVPLYPTRVDFPQVVTQIIYLSEVVVTAERCWLVFRTRCPDRYVACVATDGGDGDDDYQDEKWRLPKCNGTLTTDGWSATAHWRLDYNSDWSATRLCNRSTKRTDWLTDWLLTAEVLLRTDNWITIVAGVQLGTTTNQLYVLAKLLKCYDALTTQIQYGLLTNSLNMIRLTDSHKNTRY